jgi:multidrug efflux system outer membrane protein
MKNKMNRYSVSFAVGLLVLSACSLPKNIEEQQIKPLPDTFDGQASEKKEAFVPIELKTYFQDAELLQLFEKIKQSNPDYQIVQQRILIANSHLKRSKLALLPSLDLSVNASGTRYGDHTMEGVGNFDTNLSQNIEENQKIRRDVTPNFWIGAQTSWEIDVWGRLRNKKKAAQQRYFASHEGMRLLQNQLFTDVADLYYQLIAFDRKMIIYQENYAVQQRAFEIILAQRSAGKATELAVQQFGAQSQNLLAGIEQLKLDISATEKALLTMIGEYGGTISRGSEFMSNHLSILNQNMSVDSVIHKRPDVSESYYELIATHADAKSARAAFFPKLQIGAYGAFNAFSFSTLFNPGSLAWQLLGGLVAPVFNQGQLRQEFFVANRQQEIAFFTYQKNVVTAYNELSLLLKQVESYQNILSIKSEEVAYLDRAVDVSNDLYLTGYANYLEIINSQKNKLQAELDFVDYQQRNAKALVLLYKALGGEMK